MKNFILNIFGKKDNWYPIKVDSKGQVTVR